MHGKTMFASHDDIRAYTQYDKSLKEGAYLKCQLSSKKNAENLLVWLALQGHNIKELAKTKKLNISINAKKLAFSVIEKVSNACIAENLAYKDIYINGERLNPVLKSFLTYLGISKQLDNNFIALPKVFEYEQSIDLFRKYYGYDTRQVLMFLEKNNYIRILENHDLQAGKLGLNTNFELTEFFLSNIIDLQRSNQGNVQKKQAKEIMLYAA